MRHLPFSRNKKCGFTLVELMIVVSIVGILATIAIPKFADMVRKSREGALKGNLGSLRSALAIYYAGTEGQYPGLSGPVGAQWGILASGLVLYSNIVASEPIPYVADYHAQLPPTECGGPCYDWGVSEPSVSAFFAGQGLSVGDADGGPGWNMSFWVYFAAPAYPATWGQVYVWCTHTDTKGASWSSY